MGNDTALLVIDVQQGLFRKSSPIYKAEELLANIGTLIDRARRAGTPIFFIQHSSEKVLLYGSDDWQLHPRLQPLAGEPIIHKRHPSALEETTLGQELASRNVGRLVVTGLVTHGCVRATCLDAKRLGYQVILVTDGHSSYSKQAAELIAEWHQKLSEANVELRPTHEIDFHDERPSSS